MILTFYSFKGGVGRTMALANIAYLLVKMGKNVLAVDWDLEAPGLVRYFELNGFRVSPSEGERGLLDLLLDASGNSKPDWRHYISWVALPPDRLSLLTAGRPDKLYASVVQSFDWDSFFKNSDGGAFIESLREEWLGDFDVTLIDSRTGFTDSGGVCTIQLPDVLVPVFTTNEQSLLGAKEAVQRAQEGRQSLAYDRAPLIVFPLPSRYDGRTQFNEARQWLERFASELAFCYDDWLPQTITPLQMIERTKLPYIGYFSFGEKLPVVIEGTSDPEGLGYAYETAAKLIASEFRDPEKLIRTDDAIATRPDQVSAEELAVLRMRREIVEHRHEWEWRTVAALATKAAVSKEKALKLLQADPEIEFGRKPDGEIIVKLRANRVDGEQSAASRSLRDLLRDFFRRHSRGGVLFFDAARIKARAGESEPKELASYSLELIRQECERMVADHELRKNDRGLFGL